MAIKMRDFIKEDTFSILVNFPSKIRGVISTSSSGYVLNKKIKENKTVIDYLLEQTGQMKKKIEHSLQLVKLKSSLNDVFLAKLTTSETKKVQLAECLLLSSKVIILEDFFIDFIDSEKEYFKRLLRNLLFKKKIAIIFIEDDMNQVLQLGTSFYLFTQGEKYKYIDDFYNMEIYQFVSKPETVELITYLESKGHLIDHEVTFSETLKAIYRGKK